MNLLNQYVLNSFLPSSKLIILPTIIPSAADTAGAGDRNTLTTSTLR